MCREGAWAELTVEVTSMGTFRGAARGKETITYSVDIISTEYFFIREVISYNEKIPSLSVQSDKEGKYSYCLQFSN